MKSTSFLILSFLSAFLGIGYSQETVEFQGNIYVVNSEKVHKEELDDTHISILGFAIGRHSLQDVQSKLGQAKILQAKEQAPHQICYVSNKKEDGTAVIFEAGPIGGWEYITAFSLVSSKANFKERNQCTKSPLVSTDVKTRSGIKLGLTKNQLTKILGEPTIEQGSNILYYYNIRQRMTEKEIEKMSKLWPEVIEDPYADVSSFVEATLFHSEVVSISISKIETY